MYALEGSKGMAGSTAGPMSTNCSYSNKTHGYSLGVATYVQLDVRGRLYALENKRRNRQGYIISCRNFIRSTSYTEQMLLQMSLYAYFRSSTKKKVLPSLGLRITNSHSFPSFLIFAPWFGIGACTSSHEIVDLSEPHIRTNFVVSTIGSTTTDHGILLLPTVRIARTHPRPVLRTRRR